MKIFCASYLKNSKFPSDNVYDENAPYHECRGVFLGLWSDWSNYAALSGILLVIVCLFIAILTFVLRRKSKLAQNDDLMNGGSGERARGSSFNRAF